MNIIRTEDVDDFYDRFYRLTHREPRTISEIAKACQRSRGWVSRRLKALGRGVVVRSKPVATGDQGRPAFRFQIRAPK